MAYRLYMDGMLFPVPPEKLTISVSNKNETVTLIDQGEVNKLRSPGLTDISFEILLPNTEYGFAQYINKEFKPASDYTDKLEDLKVNKEPFNFKYLLIKPDDLTRIQDITQLVSLEDYDISYDDKDINDVRVQIKLKTYRTYGTKKQEFKTNSSGTKAMSEKKQRKSKVKAVSYTVKSGDSLWKIAKTQLNDGDKWSDIASLNGIKSPYTINTGQVLKLG